MKVAVLADTHYGVRGDDPNLRATQCKFMEKVFLPTLRERGITKAVHLGDLFDRKKYVNFVTADACWRSLVGPLIEMGVSCEYIVGNHDCYYRNTNALNSVQTIFGDSVDVVSDPRIRDGIMLVPWICEENAERTTEMLKSRPRIVLGHLELSGFEMYRGQPVNQGGHDPSMFAEAEIVLSGHFHTRSKRGNVEYIGSTGQYTWADHGDERGFVILDTDTCETEFVPNPYESFTRIVYDDAEGEEAVMARVEQVTVEGRYVKLVIDSKNDPFLLERVIDRVEARGVVDLQVIEGGRTDEVFDPNSVHIVDGSDTLHVLTEMVTERARDTMKELYVKAQSRL